MSGCPTCGTEGEVTNSRPTPKGRWRQRRCPAHGKYSTLEISADELAELRKTLKATDAERRKIARALPILERLSK